MASCRCFWRLEAFVSVYHQSCVAPPLICKDAYSFRRKVLVYAIRMREAKHLHASIPSCVSKYTNMEERSQLVYNMVGLRWSQKRTSAAQALRVQQVNWSSGLEKPEEQVTRYTLHFRRNYASRVLSECQSAHQVSETPGKA